MRSRRFEPPIITGVLPIRNIQERFYPITMNTLIGDRYFRDNDLRRCSGKACEGHHAEYGKHITDRQHDGNVLNEAKVERRNVENKKIRLI